MTGSLFPAATTPTTEASHAVPSGRVPAQAKPSPQPDTTRRLEPLDRPLLKTLLARSQHRTWADTGLLLDHLAERGRLAVLVGLDGDDWTIMWGPGAAAHVSATHAIPHVAVVHLCESLIGEDAP